MTTALVAASALAGCGSGSGHAFTPVSPSSAPTGALHTSNAAITISIPRTTVAAATRGRHFVSPSTDGVSVTVTHSTGGVTDYDVTTNYDVSPGTASTCAGKNPEVCTLAIPAPVAPSPDFDTFTFTLYDQAPGGTPPTFGTSAHLLGSGTSTASINANAQNTVNASIEPVPGRITFKKFVLSGDGYLGFTKPVTFSVLDVNLNTITAGTYDPLNPAVTIGVNTIVQPAGATTLAIAPPDLSSFSPAPPVCNVAATKQQSVSTCRTADAVTASYLQPAGIAFAASYFSTLSTAATDPVTTTTPLYISPIFVLDTTDPATSANGPTFTQGFSGTSPVLSLDGGTGTITLSNPGALTEGTAATFSPNENSGCNGVIPSGGIVTTSLDSFTITGSKPSQPGTQTNCVITFTDNFGGTVLLDVVNTATVSAPGA